MLKHLALLFVAANSAHAIPLAIDFRSPRIGEQIPTTQVGSDPSNPNDDPLQITLKDGIVLTDTNGSPFIWSPQYGLLEATPYSGGEWMTITGLPGVTGVFIDDIQTPYIATPDGPLIPVQATQVPYFGVGVNDGPYLFTGPNTITDGGVVITYGPVENGQEFISFSQPVDEVYVGQYISSFAVAGFTTSEPAKHRVPDDGNTLMLLAGGLLGLFGIKKWKLSTS